MTLQDDDKQFLDENEVEALESGPVPGDPDYVGDNKPGEDGGDSAAETGNSDTHSTDEEDGSTAGEQGGVADTTTDTHDEQGDTAGDEEEPQQVVDERDVFVPKYEVAAPENAQSRIEEIANELNQLGVDFDEGEIDPREYHEKLTSLMTERSAIENQLAQAELTQKINQQAAAQAWEDTQERFFSRPENSIYKEDPDYYDALSNIVKRVAVDPDFLGRSDAAILNEADRRFRDKFMPGAGGDSGAGESTNRPQTRGLPQHPDMPKTLSDVQSEQASGPTSEFAHLDKLTGIEYEEALAAMSDADRERYLEAG